MLTAAKALAAAVATLAVAIHEALEDDTLTRAEVDNIVTYVVAVAGVVYAVKNKRPSP